MKTVKNLSDYLECALWSSTDEDGTPLDEKYEITDIDTDSIDKAKKDLDDFMKGAEKLFSRDDSHQVPGHDFWLTRNGHGAGFWDGNYVNGDALTALCKPYGECNLYIGDDNKIYIN